jgi:hypothetical protein
MGQVEVGETRTETDRATREQNVLYRRIQRLELRFAATGSTRNEKVNRDLRKRLGQMLG